MSCTPIKQKYKNSFVTFLIFIGSLLILDIMLTSKDLVTTLNSEHSTIILFIIAFTVSSYVYIFDPTMLCGVLQKDCRKRVATNGMIQALLFFPVFSLLIKTLIGEHSPLRWIIPLFILACGLTCCWIKYKGNPDTILNHKLNVLKCHKIRLVFYMLILAFDLFNALQFYKQRLPSDQLAQNFNLPTSFGFILVPFYILYTVVFPVINDTMALDGAVKYDIKDINIT